MTGRGLGRGTLRPKRDVTGLQVWQADWRGADGRRHRRFLGPNKRDAERALAKLIADRDAEINGIGRSSGVELSIRGVIDSYVADLRTRARPKTIHDAVVTLDRLVAELPLRIVRDVMKVRVMQWRERRQREGASNKTINTAISTLSAAINFGVRMDIIARNPLAGLRALPTKHEHRRRVARALNDAEIARIFHAAHVYDRTHPGLPRAPLLRALVETGARWGEATSATWGDVNFETGMLHIRAETAKNKTGRAVPMSPELLDMVADLRQSQTLMLGDEPRQHEVVFLTPEGARWPRKGCRFRDYLVTILKRAGVKRVDEKGHVVHIHAMRHTFASRLARNGIPIQTAAMLTGHKSLPVLMEVYTHLGEQEARNAIRALRPLPDVASLQGPSERAPCDAPAVETRERLKPAGKPQE